MPDIFDTLLNSTMDVQEKGHAASDIYNQQSQILQTICTAVACRISRNGFGKEQTQEKLFATNTFVVFARPVLTKDDTTPFVLTEHHWLLLHPADGSSDILGNIIAINNPSALGHHIEMLVKEVKA